MKLAAQLPIDISGDIENRLNTARLPQSVQELYFSTIKHPLFEEALEALEDCFDISGFEAAGCRIFGVPGAGKSWLLRYFIYLIYSRPEYQPTDELTPLPILYIRVPGKPSINRVIEKLLESARHLAPSPKSGESASIRLNALIRNQQTRMLVFDECHHLLREYAMQRTNDVVSFIKLLMDEHALSVVFAGKPETEQLLYQFPELEQRLSYANVKLAQFRYKKSGPANIEEFASYLKALDMKFKQLGMNCEAFGSKDMYLRIWLATKGLPRHVNQFAIRVARDFERNGPVTQDRMQALIKRCAYANHLDHFQVFKAAHDKVVVRANRYEALLTEQAKAAQVRRDDWIEKYR